MLSAPLQSASSTTVKTVASAQGPGSIELTKDGDVWNFEWKEITDDVKETVRKTYI